MELSSEDFYAACWRIVQLTVHRYESCPAGQLLVVLTIILLDRLGHNPTVAEVANLTQLPKSNVSRYLDSEMKAGFLSEKIDPADRRRRILFPTAEAKQEYRWHETEIKSFVEGFRATIDQWDAGQGSADGIAAIFRQDS